MFTTIAVGLLLRGPVENIAINAGDLAGVSNCVSNVLYNQTGYLQELAKGPYRVLVAG